MFSKISAVFIFRRGSCAAVVICTLERLTGYTVAVGVEDVGVGPRIVFLVEALGLLLGGEVRAVELARILGEAYRGYEQQRSQKE